MAEVAEHMEEVAVKPLQWTRELYERMAEVEVLDPTDAVLIVEAADASLSYDQFVESKLYARAGIQDYRVLNVIENALEMYRDPSGDAYHRKNTFDPDDAVAPLERPDLFHQSCRYAAVGRRRSLPAKETTSNG